MKLITVCVKQNDPNYFFLYDESRITEEEAGNTITKIFNATDQLYKGNNSLSYWDIVELMTNLTVGLEYIRKPLVVDIQ